MNTGRAKKMRRHLASLGHNLTTKLWNQALKEMKQQKSKDWMKANVSKRLVVLYKKQRLNESLYDFRARRRNSNLRKRLGRMGLGFKKMRKLKHE